MGVNLLEKFQYLRFVDGDHLPIIKDFYPFKALLILDSKVSIDWQEKSAKWLVNQGCLYMLAWGQDCSNWEDAVDLANIETFSPEDIPDDHFVMTTCHDDESIEDMIEFAVRAGTHPSKELDNYLFFHVSDKSREDEFKKIFLKYVW